MTADQRTFTLPFPPSVNRLFPGKQRRFASTEYKSWREAADWEIARARVRPIDGKVRIRIDLHPDSKRKADCDNFNKAILDCLVRMRIIEDDNHSVVRELTTAWGEMRSPPSAVITIVQFG